MANITCLPNEIIFSILELEDISIKDVTNFSLTCKKLHMAIKDNNVLWKRKLFQRWPVLQEVCTLYKPSMSSRSISSRSLVLDMKTIFDTNRLNEVEPCEDDEEMIERHKLYRIQAKDSFLNLVSFGPIFEYIYCLDQVYLEMSGVSDYVMHILEILNIHDSIEKKDTISPMLIQHSVHFLKNRQTCVQDLGLMLLTRIVTSAFKHTETIINYGAIPPLVLLLKASREDARRALWILLSIIEDVPCSSDVILSYNAVPLLLDLIKTDDMLVRDMRDIVWMLVKLWHNKDPPPPFNIIKSFLPVLDRQLDDTY